MPDALPLDVYACDADMAAERLAVHLGRGSLVLMLGAGVSADMGLPRWWKLVNACCKATGVQSDDIVEGVSNELLRKRMDRVEQLAEYLDTVHDCLYQDVEYAKTAIQMPLLIALGALLMGSRRGRIKSVVTFNFDDVLEWYLDLHGFTTQVVDSVPALLREEDVVIYHQHGFLPKHTDVYQRSREIVFSQMSYDLRLGDAGKPWRELMGGLLLSHVGLFVGLSGDDPTFGPAFVDVKRALSGSRETGFWLLKKADPRSDDARRGDLLARNIVPVFFNGFEEIPDFLLAVCQKAARLKR